MTAWVLRAAHENLTARLLPGLVLGAFGTVLALDAARWTLETPALVLLGLSCAIWTVALAVAVAKASQAAAARPAWTRLAVALGLPFASAPLVALVGLVTTDPGASDNLGAAMAVLVVAGLLAIAEVVAACVAMAAIGGIETRSPRRHGSPGVGTARLGGIDCPDEPGDASDRGLVPSQGTSSSW